MKKMPLNLCAFDLQEAGLSLICEERRRQAYEILSDAERSWLKLTLALVHAVYGQSGSSWQGTRREDLGFVLKKSLSPVDWVLCLVDSDFTSAARFISALMTARLAGCGQIIVVWDKDEAASSMLTALDLAGIDEAYILRQNLQHLLEVITKKAGSSGRILRFGNNIPINFEILTGWKNNIWQDTPPQLCADNTADISIIRRTHPDAVWNLKPLTAFYGQKSNTPPDCLIHFSPGLEGSWLYPNLSPEFFMTSRHSLNLLLPEDIY